jgi:fatty acid-binding protein DegV
MNIDKFKHQRVEIMTAVSELRNLIKSGVAEHAAQILSMSTTIKPHLSVEVSVLYPALEQIQAAV